MKVYPIFLFIFHLSTYAQEKNKLPCLEIRKFESKKNLISVTEKIQGKITEQLLELGKYRFRIINPDSKISSINYNLENLTLGSEEAQKNLNEVTQNSCEQILKAKVKKIPTKKQTNQKNKERYELRIYHTETKSGNLLFSKVIDLSEKNIDFYVEELARKILDPSYRMDQPEENSDVSEKKKKSKTKKKVSRLGSKVHSWFDKAKEKNKKDFEKEKRKTIP